MDESKDKKLQNKIKNHFEKMSYGEKYNFDIVITILAIVFVVYVVFYVYFSSRINLEKINWEKNKCNPFYMPFAKTIHNGGEGFNEDNLKNCLNSLTSNLASDMLEPINATANIFLIMFAAISGMFSQFLTYIRYLYEWLLSLFEEMMIILQRIAMENSIIFSKINNFIGSLLGFMSVVYYQLVLVVDSIKLIFPMIGLSFFTAFVLPTTLSFSLVAVLLVGVLIIAIIFSPVFCSGCWAWVPVALLVVLLVILGIFLTIVIGLYVIFMNATKDILERTLTPMSVNDDT